MIFNIYEEIAHLSKAVTQMPRDLIFTGTPSGVGVAMKPPHFLRAGDIVEVETGEIGMIKGQIVDEDLGR